MLSIAVGITTVLPAAAAEVSSSLESSRAGR